MGKTRRWGTTEFGRKIVWTGFDGCGLIYMQYKSGSPVREGKVKTSDRHKPRFSQMERSEKVGFLFERG
jgi:hypothetical protein